MTYWSKSTLKIITTAGDSGVRRITKDATESFVELTTDEKLFSFCLLPAFCQAVCHLSSFMHMTWSLFDLCLHDVYCPVLAVDTELGNWMCPTHPDCFWNLWQSLSLLTHPDPILTLVFLIRYLPHGFISHLLNLTINPSVTQDLDFYPCSNLLL